MALSEGRVEMRNSVRDVPLLWACDRRLFGFELPVRDERKQIYLNWLYLSNAVMPKVKKKQSLGSCNIGRRRRQMPSLQLSDQTVGWYN